MSVREIDGKRPMKCPAPEQWSMLAGGLSEGPDSDRLLAHAASCAKCAAVLKDSIEMLSDDADDAVDVEPMPAPESSKREWQRATALRMARRPRRSYWLPVAAALACVFAGSAAWWLWREQNRAPLDLLAKAYTARRPVELRTPGAAWSEVRVERGAGSALEAAELLESEAKIARNITAHSADPEWLHAQGLAQLLEWEYGAAIESLRMADDLAPPGDPKGRAGILLDLSTAYFERAKATSNPLDYSLSLDSVSTAVQLDPSLNAALFNRAIVYEAEHQYFLAVEDWKKYLEKDRLGPWADEARRRLGDVQKKIEATKPAAKNRIDDVQEQQIATGEGQARAHASHSNDAGGPVFVGQNKSRTNPPAIVS